MERFNYLTDLETRILRIEFGRLMGTEKQTRVITGFNYYYNSIDPKKLVIAISFLHRAEELKKDF